jgi:predicted Zn finger-like uncharacterized protein
MDVRCGRCGTEYDFDDALVSERGTTVKCTNCGHQFKVYPGGGGGAPERWIVRKASGRELVYTSLRDLQRAIAQRQVGPTDLLSRGGAHPLRTLASIAELEPFFQAQGPAPSETAQRTLLGVAPASGGRGIPDDTEPDNPPMGDTFPSAAEAPRFRSATQIGGVGAPRRSVPPAAYTAPPAQAGAPYRAAEEAEPSTIPRNSIPEHPQTTDASTAIPMAHVTGYAPQGGAPPPPEPAHDGMSAAFRSYQDSYSDEEFPSVVQPRRSSALKWVVGLLVLGGVAFVGGTVGVKYLKRFAPVSEPAPPPKDDRVQKLLAGGEADLARGDFESAKEKFDKASALAEKDATVLSALARLEATRADVRWLGLRLIDPASKAELDDERAELDANLARVTKATDAAAAVAPNDPAVLRARIDALRLNGDLAKARELVGSLSSDSSQPETAYVLAALDLAEPTPSFSTVVDRLRTAAAAERGFGRARAALVYALAESGALDEARAELGKIESSGPQRAFFGRLKSFVERLAHAAPPASASAALAPSGSPSPSAAGAVPAAAAAATTAAGAAVPRGMDFRKLLEAASAAKNSGDLTRAQALYTAAQQQQPGNIEALAGLGDVERLRGNTGAASGYYEAVLQQNPTYLPALMASADMKWAAGDHPGAVALYKRVMSQTDPGTTYGQRAAQRIAEAQGSGAPHPEATAAPKPEAPAPKPEAPAPSPPANDQPNIDTSDLPGFK